MSDLLDRVRAVNPVPTCDPPSIADVWSKLERDATVTTEPRVRRVRSPRRAWIASTALAVTLAAVVLVLAGGAGRRSASAPRSGPTPHATFAAAVRRLADGTISCRFAASSAGATGIGPVATRGRSAIAFCRDRYLAAAGRPGAARATFVVCETSATNVTVYVADGRPAQCARLGDRTVPAGYAAAVRRSGSRVATLPVSEPTSSV